MNAVEIRRRRVRRQPRRNILPGIMGGCAAIILLSTLLLTLGAFGTVIGVYAYYAKDLPPADEIGLRTSSDFQTSRIYDRTGQHLLYELIDPQGGSRTRVPLHKIPAHLRNATVAMEDKTFYTNPGINIEGLLRAFISNLQGNYIQGGSSLTQQLVKLVLIDPEERYVVSYARKIKEAILALELSRRYPGLEGKDQILEWYLNTVHYGRLAYGVEAAAEQYFGKSVEEITLAEAAMLAAIPQYPLLNPIDNWEEAKYRQEIVLDQMYLQGYITAEEAWEAKQEEIVIVSKPFNIQAPHFVMYVRQLLEQKYGLEAVYRKGLRVYTTLDLELQQEVERIAREHIASLRDKHKVTNASVVVINPHNGEIRAMLGSLDYFDRSIDGQVNVALFPRQPGSSFKPFTYVTAFAQGYTPATMVLDIRTSFDDWPNPPYVPENYDRKYHGPISLRRALACSYNIPAVAVLSWVGVDNVLETAHRMGINTLLAPYYGLSLTLGGGEVRLLDLTYAYGVFANGGVMAGEPTTPIRPGFRELDPVAILRIEDSDGNLLYEYKEPRTQQVISPQLAYLITDVLADNQARSYALGPNSALKLSRPAAAKTGTTENFHDAWTIGYTPDIVVGVWVGNSNNEPMERLPSVTAAGPIYHNVMEYLFTKMPEVDFVEPPGIVHVEVDAKSGLLPTQYSGEKRNEVFIEGMTPTAYDNVHRPFRICTVSGKLATVFCPLETVEEQVFEIYPPDAADWLRDEAIPQPPADYCPVHGAQPIHADVAIISPTLYSYVRGIVPIIGNAKPGDFNFWRLQYGAGMNPASWTPATEDRYDRVDNGVLAYWDVSPLDGLYTLQLTVVGGSGNVQTSAVQVTVDNTPPEVSVVNPWADKVYEMETDEWVNIQVDVRDNYAMGRVDFYLDDKLIGSSNVAPYSLRWTITMSTTMTETHQVHAVGFDLAGNETTAEKVEFKVRHKPKAVEPSAGLLPAERRRYAWLGPEKRAVAAPA